MKILNKLTNKHLMMNKKRTIVTIIGIMLSTALMCGIGLLISTFRDYSIKETISNSGDYFLKVSDFPRSEIKSLEKLEPLDGYYERTNLGYFVIKSFDHYSYYGNLVGVDSSYLENFKLQEGRYPKNDREIVLSQKTVKYLNINVGDPISFDVGNLVSEDIPLEDDGYIPQDAKLENTKTKEYTVVGILEGDQFRYEEWYDQGYAFTIDKTSEEVTLYLKSKSAKDIFDLGDTIKKDIKEDVHLSYNDTLLALYGASKYNNVTKSMAGVMAIILFLISIGCTIVIYNSFAISVMERKKQFGLFASIGATKSQLRYTVFYEAFIVGTIGIILGIIASFIGIGAVIYIINHLLGDVFKEGLSLTVYPLFFIIPIIFMIFVILFSAYMPARRASKVSPISAIRGNDDIKINKRKIKISKLSKRLFGVEGEIALKNIKRNKKKYRITIISLVTSIVLFISFSSLLDKMINIDSFLLGIDYDLCFQYYENKDESSEESRKLVKQQFEQIISNEEVKEYSFEKGVNTFYTKDKFLYTPEYQEVFDDIHEGQFEGEDEWKKFNETYHSISVSRMDVRTYEALKRKYHLKEDRPILINRFETIIYGDNNRKMKKGRIYKDKIDSISLCDMSTVIQNGDYEKLHTDDTQCGKAKISNIYMIDDIPLGFMERGYGGGLTILVSEKMGEEIYDSLYGDVKDHIQGISHSDENLYYNLYLTVDGYESLDKYMSQIDENDTFSEYYYNNVLEEMKQMMNTVFAIKLLFYGFISLVTLIGVTSVFNTLNTSIALRKKEFSMLRSMGLTPKGLNRMIIFESVFFGVKSLAIGIPISLVFVYWITWVTDSISTTGFIFPMKPILISIVAVFVIVLVTMRYATSKIRHDNILDAIREENI